VNTRSEALEHAVSTTHALDGCALALLEKISWIAP
jgi:hypothetical protein